MGESFEFYCFGVFLFSADDFLSNHSLNSFDRIGSENAFVHNHGQKSPNKHGPVVGILRVPHGMVHWINCLHSTPFSTGVAKAALKFLGKIQNFKKEQCW